MADPAPQPAPVVTMLAFDFGVRRIGVAIGNSLTASARALDIIEEPVTARRFARIGALIAQWAPQALLVGRPTDEDGEDSETTLRAERFARQLAGRFGLPVDMVDERFSSREAQRHVGRHQADDAEAAAIILRQYFDERRNP